MVKNDFNDMDGVWRTVGGRRIFIRTGQSLSDAMKKSGKFKSAKKKNEVKDESKSFSREELKEKYGTDNTDIINAGKEKEDRVALKEDKKELNLSQRQKDEGNRLSQKAKDMAKDDINTYLKGNKGNWNNDDDFVRDLANEHNIDRDEAQKMFNYQKYVNDTLNNDEYLKANRPNEYFQKQLKESGVKTFADEIKENDVANRVKENKIVDSYGKNVVYQTKKGNYITSRQNYNDYVNGKTNKLGGELVLNEKEARERLASYDADEKYPYKGYVNDVKTGNGQKAEELKKETLNKMYKSIGYDDSKYNYGLEKTSNEKYTIETISKAEYDKMPNDYKGTLKELVDTAEFRGENKKDLIKQYEKMGYDVNKDKTILVNEKGGTVLKPVKISDSNEKYSIDYFKQRGVEIKDSVPKGYVKLEGATTAPKGYEWYSNGKSRFGGEYKNALVKKENTSSSINNTIRRKAYQKYLKEHPASKITFEDFKDMNKMK